MNVEETTLVEYFKISSNTVEFREALPWECSNTKNYSSRPVLDDLVDVCKFPRVRSLNAVPGSVMENVNFLNGVNAHLVGENNGNTTYFQ